MCSHCLASVEWESAALCEGRMYCSDDCIDEQRLEDESYFNDCAVDDRRGVLAHGLVY